MNPCPPNWGKIKSPASAQRFVSLHAAVYNCFNLQRHLVSRCTLRTFRAQAVADMLVDLGIDEKRLQVEGYGDQYPIEANASERGRAQNRRVEIVFSDDKGKLAPAR